MIIAGFAGVGKTAFARMHPDEAIDFVCMPYKYELDDSLDEDESCKANPDNVLRPDWPFNYVDAIEKVKSDYKYVVIPSDTIVLSLLRERGIPFIVVRPLRGAKEEYRRRFIERGNSEDFIEVFIDHWDSFMDSLERVKGCVQITTDLDEYLSDVVDNSDILAVTMVIDAMELLIASGSLEVVKEDGFTKLNIKSDNWDWLKIDEDSQQEEQLK
ncbi:MAG: hypothetical protein LBK67_01960 [Coriobacteriales bacterium]|jgi:hypothetical protein|nr:hypothetical protein [Coriobacteriales bacterium]